MQALPNIAALTDYNDSSPDNLYLTHRLRAWCRSGSSWTLYISILTHDLHHWYLTIPPSHNNDYFRAIPQPLPHTRTSLHLPRPTPPQLIAPI